MVQKFVSPREFQETCLSLIDEVGRTHEAITIVDHGKAVARLVPSEERVAASDNKERRSVVIGGLKGSVLHYDAPFGPAADASDWEASA